MTRFQLLRSATVMALLTAVCGPAFSMDPSAEALRVDRQIAQGDYVTAFEGAVDLFEQRLGDEPPTADALDALRLVGVTLRKMGDLELADAVWRIYHDAASSSFGACDPRVAEAICQIGSTARGISSNYDDTFPYYVEALSLLDYGNRAHQELIARILRGEANYFRYRDKARSLQLFETAIATLECALPETARECAETRVWLGWTLLHMGRHDEARAQLLEARAEFAALGLEQHDLMGTVESAFADLDIVAGRWADAEKRYVHAVDLFARARRNGSTRFAEFPLHGYNLVALAQLKQGKFDDAWESLQRYRSPTGKRLASLREWKARSSETYAAVSAARDAVLAHRSLRRQRSDDGLPVDWAAVAGELKANARLCELEARYYAPFVEDAVSLSALQAAIPDDGAYIGWLDARVANELLCSTGPILDSRWMYIVRKRGPVRWIPLWEFDQARAMEAWRRPAADHKLILMRAAQWTLRVEDDREMDRLARAAAEQEFDQALPYLDGVRQIVFEYFEDIIGFRPLEGLVLNDGAYLGDRFVISYSPSADIFVSSHQGAVRSLSPSVFAMGDALFNENQGGPVAISGSIDQTQHRSVVGMLQHRAATNGDPGALAALPRLPFAGVELNRIAALYPGAVVLREHDATEANIRKYLAGSPAQRVDIIHMATHALSETPLRQRCALALSRRGVDASPGNDGLVDALEIQLGWNLDADLVCLSGCQTASGPGWFRGEPMGLSTILLGVGARSVIASMWKVDDLATARLMERFYENLSGKYADVRAGHVATAMSKAQALAEAKRWLRLYTTPEGRKPFAHPVYWSGFILIGDPG